MKKLIVMLILFCIGFSGGLLVLLLVDKAHAQKPGSSVIELSSPVIIPAAPASITVPNPLGTMVNISSRAVFVVKVTSAPVNGGGQSLDVYFSSSADDGQTWLDFIRLNTTTTGTFYIPMSNIAAGPPNPQMLPVVFLTPGCTQWPLGNRIRTQFNANMGTGTTGMWAYQAYVLPN